MGVSRRKLAEKNQCGTFRRSRISQLRDTIAFRSCPLRFRHSRCLARSYAFWAKRGVASEDGAASPRRRLTTGASTPGSLSPPPPLGRWRRGPAGRDARRAGCAEDDRDTLTRNTGGGRDATREGAGGTGDGRTGGGKTGDGETRDGETGDEETGDGETGDGETGGGRDAVRAAAYGALATTTPSLVLAEVLSLKSQSRERPR